MSEIFSFVFCRFLTSTTAYSGFDGTGSTNRRRRIKSSGPDSVAEKPEENYNYVPRPRPRSSGVPDLANFENNKNCKPRPRSTGVHLTDIPDFNNVNDNKSNHFERRPRSTGVQCFTDIPDFSDIKDNKFDHFERRPRSTGVQCLPDVPEFISRDDNRKTTTRGHSKSSGNLYLDDAGTDSAFEDNSPSIEHQIPSSGTQCLSEDSKQDIDDLPQSDHNIRQSKSSATQCRDDIPSVFIDSFPTRNANNRNTKSTGTECLNFDVESAIDDLEELYPSTPQGRRAISSGSDCLNDPCVTAHLAKLASDAKLNASNSVEEDEEIEDLPAVAPPTFKHGLMSNRRFSRDAGTLTGEYSKTFFSFLFTFCTGLPSWPSSHLLLAVMHHCCGLQPSGAMWKSWQRLKIRWWYLLGTSVFLHLLQLASRELAYMRQKKWQ